MRLHCTSIAVHILRFVLYKTISFIRKCRNTTSQMWIKNNAQNFYSSLNRSRKIVLCIGILLVILLYLWPTWLPHISTTNTKAEPLELCIGAKLETFRKAEEHFDAIINHIPLEEGEHDYPPYIGNGYLGTVVQPKQQLYLKNGRALTMPINFYPIVQINFEKFPSQEAHVIDLRSGLVYKIQCFELGKLCVNAATQFYAHRHRPSLLVQELRIHNPTDTPVTVELHQIGASDWQGATSREGRISSSRNADLEYTVAMGTVPVVGSTQGLVHGVAIANVKIPDMVTVKPAGTWRFHMVTAVRYLEEPHSPVGIEADVLALGELAEKDLTTALNIETTMLRQDHVKIWQDLWKSGFGISSSLAAGVLNGDKINTTMYYVMSHSRTPLQESEHKNREIQRAEKLLFSPDRCYEGHHTLQNTKMWEDVSTVERVIEQVKTWMVTLEKQGCSSMMKAGAEGVLQAMLLSFGTLRFKNDHLEYEVNPKDLHRDFFFRRLNYGNNTHVNISVVVGDDNKASLFVSLDRNDRPYYACDAGCLGDPVKLSREILRFPVKLTSPLTPILYITSDLTHMNELSEAIHLRDIVEAPAHEHFVMALHRHGHHYGGLPMIFWVSIGILIAIFHAFLFKLIFQEYCQTHDVRYVRAKYNL